jgi:hypothetical protein
MARRTVRSMISWALLTVLLPLWGVTRAATFVGVSDAGQLYYQTDPTGKVYFRNVNTFSTQALGCCYNYYIDTTTAEGKALFAIFLLDVGRAAPIIFLIPDNMAPGAVSFGGYWQ